MYTPPSILTHPKYTHTLTSLHTQVISLLISHTHTHIVLCPCLGIWISCYRKRYRATIILCVHTFHTHACTYTHTNFCICQAFLHSSYQMLLYISIRPSNPCLPHPTQSLHIQLGLHLYFSVAHCHTFMICTSMSSHSEL